LFEFLRPSFRIRRACTWSTAWDCSRSFPWSSWWSCCTCGPCRCRRRCCRCSRRRGFCPWKEDSFRSPEWTCPPPLSRRHSVNQNNFETCKRFLYFNFSIHFIPILWLGGTVVSDQLFCVPATPIFCNIWPPIPYYVYP